MFPAVFDTPVILGGATEASLGMYTLNHSEKMILFS